MYLLSAISHQCALVSRCVSRCWCYPCSGWMSLQSFSDAGAVPADHQNHLKPVPALGLVHPPLVVLVTHVLRSLGLFIDDLVLSMLWLHELQSFSEFLPTAVEGCSYIWQDGRRSGKLQCTHQCLPRCALGHSCRPVCVWPGTAAKSLCHTGRHARISLH